ncbi:MAG: RNA methyltransferase [SAR324 cluster bacterium]|nr:RNA methyltransferase [SAR324 cluster bacterium]
MTKALVASSQLQIVLVEPSHPGNIGAIARAMGNFNSTELAIVRPKCDPLDPEAQARACHGVEILKSAKIFESCAEAVARSHFILAATSRERSFFKQQITPHDFARIFLPLSGIETFSLLFGNERTGLENEDLALATHIVNIPTNIENPSLNLSQAALLLLWEFSKLTDQPLESFSNGLEPAIANETEGFKAQLFALLEKVGFFKSFSQRESLRLSVSDLIARARPDVRDIKMLRGIIHRIDLTIKRLKEKQ